jgi:hypothetical protein
MTQKEICQSEFEFDFYEDLDIVMDGKVGTDSYGNVEFITLNINGKEVKIEGEAADSIFEAIEVKVNNKRENIQEMELISSLEYAAEEAFIRREEMKMIDNYEIRKGA